MIPFRFTRIPGRLRAAMAQGHRNSENNWTTQERAVDGKCGVGVGRRVVPAECRIWSYRIGKRALCQERPSNLKISRVAVVPQTDRQGRIILNLFSEVPLPAMQVPGKRRKRKRVHPSENETSVPAEYQVGV
jgi:hypothetical protein